MNEEKKKALELLKHLSDLHIQNSEINGNDNTERKVQVAQAVALLATDATLEIVKRVRKELAHTYSIVCETEPQKAIARTVDNVLDDLLTELSTK